MAGMAVAGMAVAGAAVDATGSAPTIPFRLRSGVEVAAPGTVVVAPGTVVGDTTGSATWMMSASCTDPATLEAIGGKKKGCYEEWVDGSDGIYA